MSDKSHIEWTDATWNPTTGCTRVSPGCDHCYIDRTPPFRIGHRQFDKPGVGGTTGVLLHPDRLEQPLRWKKPRRIFVNSLSDLFHDDVDDDFIIEVFAIMALATDHIFQILSKRPRRMSSFVNDIRPEWISHRAERRLTDHKSQASFFAGLQWPLPNVWLGTSVEDQKRADLRIPLLLETPAAVRFLSCEPLLGHLDLMKIPSPDGRCDCGPGGDQGLHEPWCGTFSALHEGIDWVIVGGESGPNARPMHPVWALSLRDQCVASKTPFFFKQWGEWAPGFGPERDYGKCMFVTNDGQIVGLRALDVYGSDAFEHPMHVVRKIGKKHSGRELDGRTWDEMPELVSV